MDLFFPIISCFPVSGAHLLHMETQEESGQRKGSRAQFRRDFQP
jgi:hypothetical protein